MYRFLLRPRWIGFHVLVVGAVVLMLNLGFWQLRRLDERSEFNATVTERIEQEAVPVEALVDELGDAPGTDDAEAVEWREVTASGTYLADQVLVFNRSQGGRAGDNVLTPLVLDDGRIVLVNRGFVPLGVDVPPPPGSDVELVGRARPSEERRRGELTDSDEGPVTEVRRVDIDRIAPQLPAEVVPFYIDLVDSAPAPGASDPTPVPAPELDEGPHLSYAVQWFIFAACVAVGWVLAVRRSVRTRQGRSSAAVAVADPSGVAVPREAHGSGQVNGPDGDDDSDRTSSDVTDSDSTSGDVTDSNDIDSDSTGSDVTGGSGGRAGEGLRPSSGAATPTARSGTPGSSPR